MAPVPFARILVGYVPTEQGADARRLGAELASVCGADLLIVSVVAAVWLEHIGKQSGPAVVHGGQRERAASALKEAAAELADMPGVPRVERLLEASSSPARGLHEAALAQHADVVVVGSSHHGPLGRILLGSVAERLLSGAPSAVAVAPRGHGLRESRPFGAIAVAFDGSDEAHLALRAGHGLAMLSGARLNVLTVIEPPPAIPGTFVPLPGLEPQVTIERAETLQRQESAAQAAVDDALSKLGDGSTVEREVLFGTDPAAAILDAVRTDVDLLVVGSRGYGPVKRALLGGVSDAVIKHAPCPVLITPRVGEAA
jgi:nucleotide-binding universal stress UspA family protein